MLELAALPRTDQPDQEETSPVDIHSTSTQDAQLAARQAAQSRPVRWLGRIGLAAYGVVHLLVAYLAAKVAIGSQDSGSTKTDKTGALQTLAGQPGGQVLLWLVTGGLVALVIWQLAEAVWGHAGYDSGHRRNVRRIANAAEAVAFGYLAFSAGKVAAGGSGSSDSTQQSFTARVLGLPFGQVLVAVIGIGVVVVAALIVHHGVRKRFLRDMDLYQAGPKQRTAAVRLGQVGYPALGAAYGTAGVLVIVAAVTFDPKKATGMDVALATLASQPYGRILLGAISLGLVCFAAFCFFDARYRTG
jgi:Domain of Unknown Function (DUF1206)